MKTVISRLTVTFLSTMILCLCSGCEAGNEVVDQYIVAYPRVVYVAGKDTQLDLEDGTVGITTKSGAQRESAMTDRYMVESITANVNFNIPGIYTVTMVCYGEELQFPVQVIDEEFLTTYGYSAK